MPQWTLTLDTRATERAFKRLREKAPYAVARALNRAIASGTTVMIRLISQDTGIKQKDLRGTTKRNRAIWSTEAHAGRLVATVYASTERVPLMDFNAKGPRPSRGKKGRVVTAGLKGGARRYEHAFIAKMQSGHVGVFEREPGASRRGARRAGWRGRPLLPIYELFGPSIAHVWEKNAAVGSRRANEQLAKNLRHEFKFAGSQQ